MPASSAEITAFHPAKDRPAMRHDASLQLTTVGALDCACHAAFAPLHGDTARARRRPFPPFPLDARVIDADRGIDQEGERDQREQDAREREGLGARGEEGRDQRRHREIIGVALL